MAIFHLSVKVIGRGAGRSAVAAAAYRAGERLHDERLDRTHDFTNKSGVVHSEVLLPENAPKELADREKLWNAVEAAELRKDAQLSREVEFALPREMTQAQGIELARDFVAAEFVERGMIADLNVHWDIGADGLAKPHAHVMLTMREVGEDGFGAKVRAWNRTEFVEQCRERWAEHVNQRLAELDIDARIDHRSLEAQGIDLEPQDKIGPAASRMGERGLEVERIEDHRAVAQRNGERIIAEPRVALDAITHSQATFTNRDLAMFVHRHSDGRERYDAVMGAIKSSPELIALGKDGRGEERFTSSDMIETEQRLARAADMMATRDRHRVPDADRKEALAQAAERGLELIGEQRDAFVHVTDRHDLSLVVGYAGTGKSAMFGAAREAWERAGYGVRGAALSGIAAEGLENGSGIASRTIASLEHGWAQGGDLLTSRDVLVIDEAGMVGTRQMERVLSHAADAGAKVVLVGDAQQLQAIEAGAAFRAIHESHGGVEITEVRRQHEGWQQEATRHLATGRTGEAISAYADREMVFAAATREGARAELIARWDRDRQADPVASRIILTHTNDEVRHLNEAAREAMRASGDLGNDVAMKVERGDRDFAVGDRIMFLRNERSLEVKNGTLGTIERVSESSMAVHTDDGRRVAFDVKEYAHIDHGYAATIHKAQGMTVDRSHVLASPGLDRHGTYVALSRHRDGTALHYGRDDFKDQGRLVGMLSRERPKDMAQDYAKADPVRSFAEQRGITFGERVADFVKAVPEKARGIFDGLRLQRPANERDTVSSRHGRDMFTGLRLSLGKQARDASPDSERSRSAFADFRPPAPSVEPANAARAERDLAQRHAVERHARAVTEIAKMDARGIPAMAHQRSELAKAREALDKAAGRTGDGIDAGKDMEAAYARDPSLASRAAEGRAGDAIAAMREEARMRQDPALRADRFVEDWQRLEQQRHAASRAGDRGTAQKLANDMGTMAKSLERDAQMESVLRGRKSELGIARDTGRDIAQDLARHAGIERAIERGRDLGMSL